MVASATLFTPHVATCGAVAAHTSDTILSISCDTVVRSSGDTTLRHLYLTRLKRDGDTVTVRNNVFRKVYSYFQTANEDHTSTKKIDFSVIGGPHYSGDTKLGLGVVAAGLYRTNRSDPTLPLSNVSLFGDITTTGFYLLGVRGNTWFNQSRYRLDYTAYFFSFPSQFWGIGYDHASYSPASSYKRLQNQVKVDFMVRIAPNLYIGTNGSFNYIEGQDFTRPELLNGERKRYNNVGVGLFAVYDSRDFIPNAQRGVYCKLEQRAFPGFFGNRGTFTRTEFYGDLYHRVWKGGVLAYDLHAMFNYGSPPWTMLALMGGSYRMRGYYEGRYRDRNLIETQLELRQRIYRRNGIALWIGAGNVFPNFQKFAWGHTLPNYGLGYRWEFKRRMNVRLDYGFGNHKQSSFLFGIEEAF